MSGIAGLYYPGTPKPVDPARIQAMIAAMAYRGPDGSGVWSTHGVGLGHCRLATIGGAGGAQPMATSDQGVIVSFDGAIHNYRALRTELETHGLRFETDTDTEVLLHGWRAWGPGLLEHLEGSFALAIFDEGWRSLFLARDRFGAKPLHYTELSDGAVAFASELKGLLAHPMVRRQPDFHAVEDYLGLGYVPDDSCIIAGVRKLGAGHCLLLERGKPVPQPRRWWDLDFSKRAKGKTADLEAELAARMREAVRGAMIADVPVGVLLRDGMDSAALVALMAEASRSAVRTCAIGDAGHGVAERFATEHRRDRAGEDFAMLDALAAAFDEPFGDPAAVESWRLAMLGRQGFAVALAGDGADEMLAGHPRYRAFARAERTRRLLPQRQRTAVFDALGKVHSPLAALGEGGEFAYPRAIAVTPAALRQKLYSPAARKALGGHRAEHLYTQAMRRANARDALDRAQYADLAVALPGDVLARADRTGMAAGLEIREPWLDHRLVEFAASLPPSLRIKAGQGKWLMRKAMEAWLPKDLRDGSAPEPPVAEWLRGPLAEWAVGLAGSPMFGQTGWFDARVIEKLAADHRSGKADHGRTLWQLLMLERSLVHLFG
jgi:asparagine synthase (glutamine-hydrolysing)